MNQTNKQDAPVAFISGAAKRIGAVIAEHLHDAGFRIMIHCHRSIELAKKMAQSMNQRRPNSANFVTSNLYDTTKIDHLITKTVDWAGRLDLLVNNASIFSRDAEKWDELFTIHVKAPYLLSTAAFPYLYQTQGSIINITDIHAEQPLKDYSVYCQSKAALLMQTKSLAREYAPNVRVNAVAPGSIIWPEEDNQLTEDQQQLIINKTPLKRHGNPTFIAQAVSALVDNPFITGQTLRVDGGRSLG